MENRSPPTYKRIISMILTLLIFPTLLAVPALADEIDTASWINVLDYGVSSLGGNSFYIDQTGTYLSYDLPSELFVQNVDIVLYSNRTITSIGFSRYGTTVHYEGNITDLGNGYYRISCNTGNIFYLLGMTIEYSGSGSAFIQILSCRLNVRDSLGFHLPAEGSVQVAYTDTQGQYVSNDYGIYKTPTSQASNFVTLGSSHVQTSFYALIDIQNFQNKDKVHLYLWVKCNNIASIAVRNGSLGAVPFEKSVIGMITSSRNPVYMVDIIIDVSDIGNNSGLTVDISGTTTPTEDSYIVIQSLGGYIESHLPSYEVYWYESLLSGMEVGFSSVGNWFGQQITAVQTWGGNIVTSVNTWGQKIVDALNPKADTDDFRDDVDNIRDQMQDANDAMNELERPDVDDVFSDIDLDIGEDSPFVQIMGSLFENEFIVSIVTGSLAFSIFGLLVG